VSEKVGWPSGSPLLGRDTLRLSAGALLRTSLHKSGHGLRTASGPDVLHNQTALVEALNLAREEHPERPVLLEAHAFIDNDRELVDIPAAVLAALSVSAIIVVIAPPELIATRRSADRDRLRPERSAFELGCQQAHLLELTARYARELSVEVVIVDSSDFGHALTTFDRMTGRSHSLTDRVPTVGRS
jgi:hypothetical protein